MTDTPLTAPDVNLLANIGYKYALETMTTEQLRARVAELEAALSDLCDEQNGPPLLKDAESWQAAMDNARRALT